jgi:hypothetical protein
VEETRHGSRWASTPRVPLGAQKQLEIIRVDCFSNDKGRALHEERIEEGARVATTKSTGSSYNYETEEAKIIFGGLLRASHELNRRRDHGFNRFSYTLPPHLRAFRATFAVSSSALASSSDTTTLSEGNYRPKKERKRVKLTGGNGAKWAATKRRGLLKTPWSMMVLNVDCSRQCGVVQMAAGPQQ